MNKNNEFEIKFRCFFIAIVFILNSILPTFAQAFQIEVSTDNKVPICTVYGLSYIEYDSKDENVPVKNKHCKICLISQLLEGDFAYNKSVSFAYYPICSSVDFDFNDISFSDSNVLFNKPRAPPVLVI